MYTQGMQLISPDILQRHGWNQETVGDIWEAILGYCYLWQDKSGADEDLLEIASWVDSYMNSVHIFGFLASAVSDSFHSLSPTQWGRFVKHRGDCTVDLTVAGDQTPARSLWRLSFSKKLAMRTFRRQR